MREARWSEWFSSKVVCAVSHWHAWFVSLVLVVSQQPSSRDWELNMQEITKLAVYLPTNLAIYDTHSPTAIGWTNNGLECTCLECTERKRRLYLFFFWGGGGRNIVTSIYSRDFYRFRAPSFLVQNSLYYSTDRFSADRKHGEKRPKQNRNMVVTWGSLIIPFNSPFTTRWISPFTEYWRRVLQQSSAIPLTLLN